MVSRRKDCTIPPTAPYRCTTHNKRTHPHYQTSVWRRSRCVGTGDEAEGQGEGFSHPSGWDRRRHFSSKEVTTRRTDRGFRDEWILFARIVQRRCIYTDRCARSVIKDAIYNKLTRATLLNVCSIICRMVEKHIVRIAPPRCGNNICKRLFNKFNQLRGILRECKNVCSVNEIVSKIIKRIKWISM